MPLSRRRIGEGIYRDKSSLTGVVQIGSGKNKISRELAFEKDTPLDDIKRWREQTRVELHQERPHITRDSLAADILRYLERVQKRPASWKSKRSKLRAWAARLGTKRRSAIKPEDIDKAIAA